MNYYGHSLFTADSSKVVVGYWGGLSLSRNTVSRLTDVTLLVLTGL